MYDRDTAEHEASHAIVGEVLGIPTDRITVRADSSGECASVPGTWAPAGLRARMAVRLASIALRRIQGHNCVGTQAVTDLRQAGEEPLHPGEYLVSTNEAIDVATRILRRHRGALEAVAKALEARGSLSGSEARRIAGFPARPGDSSTATPHSSISSTVDEPDFASTDTPAAWRYTCSLAEMERGRKQFARDWTSHGAGMAVVAQALAVPTTSLCGVVSMEPATFDPAAWNKASAEVQGTILAADLAVERRHSHDGGSNFYQRTVDLLGGHKQALSAFNRAQDTITDHYGQWVALIDEACKHGYFLGRNAIQGIMPCATTPKPRRLSLAL